MHNYQDVAQCTKDWRTFSSADGFMVNRPAGMPYFPPAEVDPPLPRAVRAVLDEFLRLFLGVVNMARRVKKDVEVHSMKMSEGDRMLLSYGAACREPELWNEPNKVDIDRHATTHLAFGADLDRCIGESLARVVLRVGYEEFLKRIPDFSVGPDFVSEYETGSTRHMVRLPLKFDPALAAARAEGCPP